MRCNRCLIVSTIAPLLFCLPLVNKITVGQTFVVQSILIHVVGEMKVWANLSFEELTGLGVASEIYDGGLAGYSLVRIAGSAGMRWLRIRTIRETT